MNKEPGKWEALWQGGNEQRITMERDRKLSQNFTEKANWIDHTAGGLLEGLKEKTKDLTHSKGSKKKQSTALVNVQITKYPLGESREWHTQAKGFIFPSKWILYLQNLERW